VDKKSGKEVLFDIEDKINFSVFPGLQVRRCYGYVSVMVVI